MRRFERFKNELRLAHKVTHRNVARLYEFHRAGDAVYLSMEYVEGESLRALLERNGKIDIQRGLEIARQLAAGLAEAHRQSIAHRDLKPENIIAETDSRDAGPAADARLGAALIAAVAGVAVTAAVTAGEVQTVAQKYLNPDKTHIVAVGDAAKIRGALAKLGQVEAS